MRNGEWGGGAFRTNSQALGKRCRRATFSKDGVALFVGASVAVRLGSWLSCASYFSFTLGRTRRDCLSKQHLPSRTPDHTIPVLWEEETIMLRIGTEIRTTGTIENLSRRAWSCLLDGRKLQDTVRNGEWGGGAFRTISQALGKRCRRATFSKDGVAHFVGASVAVRLGSWLSCASYFSFTLGSSSRDCGSIMLSSSSLENSRPHQPCSLGRRKHDAFA